MPTIDALYDIIIDRTSRIIRTNLRGQWTLEDVERHDRDRTVTLRSTGWASGSFDCLIDLRESSVQPKEIAAAQQEALARMPLVPRRFAIIVQSALAKFQANRVSEFRYRRFFEDDAEAMAWLATVPDARTA